MIVLAITSMVLKSNYERNAEAYFKNAIASEGFSDLEGVS